MKLCNVKVLKISGAYFKNPVRHLVGQVEFGPRFNMLYNCFHLYDIHSLLQLKTFVNFLEFLPNLEALVIKKEKFNGEVNESTLSFNKVPSCLECLKSIEIKNVKGYPKELELELVKFVLKHAKVLQMVIMKISYPKEDSWEFRKRKALNKNIMMQLQTSPWASPGCVIKFSSIIKKQYNNLWQ
ncbi:hypothetical protein C5167_003628 [Papaver somniferum]|uniref:FBD domain-containing protein n=1 Tax=Papaver somniferum TaxID=3469 RepID=A0A4Y7L2L3_PAPSO|nr:hypothetical protein C5167_003628 [Papaver somniferum]